MKKTLIVLACALIVLVGLLLKNRSEYQAQQADAFVFDTTQKAAIDYLKVIDQKDTAVLQKTGGLWVVAHGGFPVDTAKINKNLSYLLSLQNKITVSRSAARLKEYGLDSAQAKYVEWHGPGNKVAKVVLGKTSMTDYSSTYWKWAGKPEVYETPGNFTWETSARDNDWKDRSFFHVGNKDIQSVHVVWRDTADSSYQYKFNVINDSTMRMVEPDTSMLVRGAGQAILNSIAALSIDDFVAHGDTNISKIRLDTPMISLDFMTKSGKSYSLQGSQALNSYVYVRYSLRPDTVKLGSWRFNDMKKKIFQLTGKMTAADSAQALKAKEKSESAKKKAMASKPSKKSEMKKTEAKARPKPEVKKP